MHAQEKQRPRQLNIILGVLPPGQKNAITDVPGVSVGHHTLVQGDSVRTGVTAIVPHQGNVFQQKVPAAVFTGNGFGKLMGSTQVEELGQLETPIILTNTLSVPEAAKALIRYTLNQPGNESVRSVNAVVGETNDGRLNDIRGTHVRTDHVLEALKIATTGAVAEGNVGAGTGTISFGYKGGIGTSSRKLPESLGGYTVGVLVQSNFGGDLMIAGVPVGRLLGRVPFADALRDRGDGSCMIVVATDAPVNSRNLKRMASRAMLGLARTGGYASNGSGDYVVAFSNHAKNLESYASPQPVAIKYELTNDHMSALFLAATEATEEAIINALFAAEDMQGNQGVTIEALPVSRVMQMLRERKSISDH